jgi:hypothetical protein
MTTPPGTPPMGASDEAEPDQPGVARAEGDADTRALQAMDQESGAVTRGAGDDLVAFVQEPAEGMDELDDGRLVGREAPTQANAHLEIAVADDAADGRFVPALDIPLTLLAGDRSCALPPWRCCGTPTWTTPGPTPGSRARVPARSGSRSPRRASCATTRSTAGATSIRVHRVGRPLFAGRSRRQLP